MQEWLQAAERERDFLYMYKSKVGSRHILHSDWPCLLDFHACFAILCAFDCPSDLEKTAGAHTTNALTSSFQCLDRLGEFLHRQKDAKPRHHSRIEDDPEKSSQKSQWALLKI